MRPLPLFAHGYVRPRSRGNGAEKGRLTSSKLSDRREPVRLRIKSGAKRQKQLTASGQERRTRIGGREGAGRELFISRHVASARSRAGRSGAGRGARTRIDTDYALARRLPLRRNRGARGSSAAVASSSSASRDGARRDKQTAATHRLAERRRSLGRRPRAQSMKHKARVVTSSSNGSPASVVRGNRQANAARFGTVIRSLIKTPRSGRKLRRDVTKGTSDWASAARQ